MKLYLNWCWNIDVVPQEGQDWGASTKKTFFFCNSHWIWASFMFEHKNLAMFSKSKGSQWRHRKHRTRNTHSENRGQNTRKQKGGCLMCLKYKPMMSFSRVSWTQKASPLKMTENLNPCSRHCRWTLFQIGHLH